MARTLSLLTFLGLLVDPSVTYASYRMFCEIKGEVVSAPTISKQIEFEFLVLSSRDIEVEGIGSGEANCHLMKGKTVTVVLDRQDTVDEAQILDGAQLTLERYEIDVILKQSGSVARSVKYVHTGD